MAERKKRKRPSNARTLEQIKADIDAREAAAAERKAEAAAARKAAREAAAKKPLTPAEKYEQEKAARAKKGSSGYGYSQHLMGGSSSSSGLNPRSVREEVIIDYLIGEGFASDEKSAQAIAGAMSEDWVQSIVEGMGLSVGSAKLIGKLASNPRTSEEQATKAAQRNITDPIGFAVKGAARAVFGAGDEKNRKMMQKRRPN